MAPPPLLNLSLIFFLFPIITATSASVHELLPKFVLPSGLLPKTVTNFSLAADDSRFVVVLPSQCYVKFDYYLVYYEKTITGKLGYGSISELKGIKVQRLFKLWLDVGEIKVDLPPSDSIYFHVGLIDKRLDVQQFKNVRSCVCKKSCEVRKFKSFLQLPIPTHEIQMLITE